MSLAATTIPDLSSLSNLATAAFWASYGWDMGPVRRQVARDGKPSKKSALAVGERVFAQARKPTYTADEWKRAIKPYLYAVHPNRDDVSKEKRGKIKGGFCKHTQHPEFLQTYFKNPEYLVGMTGPAIVVIDLDNIDEWPEAEVAKLIDLCGFVIKTPSGGYHLYFRHNYLKNGYPSRVTLGDREGFGKGAAADLKWGATGYWMAPGSKSNAKDEKRYEIIKGQPCRPEQVGMLPDEIIKYFGICSGKTSNPRGGSSNHPEAAGYLNREPDMSADEAFEKWLKVALPGTNRGQSFFDFMVNYVCAVPDECERVDEFMQKAIAAHPDCEPRFMADVDKFRAKAKWTLDAIAQQDANADGGQPVEKPCVSQEELAEFFIEKQGDDYAYNDTMGGAIFEDGRWIIDHTAGGNHSVESEFISEYGKRNYGKWTGSGEERRFRPDVRTSGSETFRRGTVKIIRDKMVRRNRVTPRDNWDRNPYVLGGPGGIVFDIERVTRDSTIEDITRPETRDDKILYHLETKPTRDYSDWLKIWKNIQKDDEIRAYAERLIGYGMFCTGFEHVFVICKGPRRSGKSVLCSAIREALKTLPGEKNDLYCTASPTVFKETRTKEDNHRHVFIGLERARIVGCPEFGDSMLDVDTMKAVVGGDEITVDPKNKAEYSFTCRNLPILVTNDEPRLHHPDPAISERVRFIPNWIHIPKEAREIHLQERLQSKSMRSQVLGWLLEKAIEYRVALLESGGRTGLLPEPEMAKQARIEWMGGVTTETRFLDAFELDPTRTYGVTIPEFKGMVREYRRQCENVKWKSLKDRDVLEDTKNYFINQERWTDDEVKSLFSVSTKVNANENKRVHFLKMKSDHDHHDFLSELHPEVLSPPRWKRDRNGMIRQRPLKAQDDLPENVTRFEEF